MKKKKIEAENIKELEPKSKSDNDTKSKKNISKEEDKEEVSKRIEEEVSKRIEEEDKAEDKEEVKKPFKPKEYNQSIKYEPPFKPREETIFKPRKEIPFKPSEEKSYQREYKQERDKSYQREDKQERDKRYQREDKTQKGDKSFNQSFETNPFNQSSQTKPSKESSQTKPFKESSQNKPVVPYVEQFKTKKSIDSDLYGNIPSGMIPLYDNNNTLFGSMPQYITPPPVPIHKIYNISLSDPLGNHSLINKIYEDILPSDKTAYSFIKLSERESIKNFMRNSILDKYDGEEISLKGGGDKSLLSWLKIYDLNPYSLVSNIKNPYDKIPYGFLLYRSAYPIRYNKKEHVLKTTSTSLAFNLRIYKLSIGALKYKNNDYFDVWRDLKYYEWVNRIIKKKISPNFLNYILYVLDNKSTINFQDLDIIREQNNNTYIIQEKNNKLINKIIQEIEIKQIKENDTEKDKDTTKNNRKIPLRDVNNSYSINESNEINISSQIISTKNIDFTTDSDKILIIVTEAPNSNIIKWNSKVYQVYGTINKMIATGYHKPEVWYSILFQLVYACAVMVQEKIYINNFSLENNVFIKDVQTDNTGNSCWVYRINNIEYYVPNYGYILVIDSNYADIKERITPTATATAPVTAATATATAAAATAIATAAAAIATSTSTSSPAVATAILLAKANLEAHAEANAAKKEIQYKIYSNDFTLNGDDVDIPGDFYNILKDLFDPTKFESNNANKLDDDVTNKINLIKQEINSQFPITFNDIFEKYFLNFIHNKVGKILTKLEKENLNLLGKPEYRPYAIMVRQKRYDEYDWVIYLGASNSVTLKQKTIICKESNKIQKIDVFPSCLYSYPENILPEDKTIIETYTNTFT